MLDYLLLPLWLDFHFCLEFVDATRTSLLCKFQDRAMPSLSVFFGPNLKVASCVSCKTRKTIFKISQEWSGWSGWNCGMIQFVAHLEVRCAISTHRRYKQFAKESPPSRSSADNFSRWRGSFVIQRFTQLHHILRRGNGQCQGHGAGTHINLFNITKVKDDGEWFNIHLLYLFYTEKELMWSGQAKLGKP